MKTYHCNLYQNRKGEQRRGGLYSERHWLKTCQSYFATFGWTRVAVLTIRWRVSQ